MLTKVRTFARYLTTNLLETDAPIEVQSRDLKGLSIPPGTVGFYFYDVLCGTVKHAGQDVAISSDEALNLSPIHLIDAQILSKEQVLTLLSQEDRNPANLKSLRESPTQQFVSIGRKFARANGTIELSAIIPYDPKEHVVVKLEPKVG